MRDQSDQAGANGLADTAPEGGSRPSGRKVLFSAMKNEAPFLLEWVAYHKAIGFDEIVICSNPSNDGTEELLAALAEAGEIRHLAVVVEEGRSPQIVAAETFETLIGFQDGTWYMWLDADEFLNVQVGDGSVTALVEALGARHCALINWRLFGTSGNDTFPGRFIDPAFVRAAKTTFRRNRAVKTLFRFSDRFTGFARVGMHRPLVAPGGKLLPEEVFVGSGNHPTVENEVFSRWISGLDEGRTNTVPLADFGWTLAQINHYVVRTPEYFALKAARGRSNQALRGRNADQRYDEAFFRYHNRNDTEDRTILRWEEAVSREIARLTRIGGVARAVVESDALLKGIMAQLHAGGDLPATAKARVAASIPISDGPQVTLVSAVKNEAPFLLEWIAYHKRIGFTKIVIFSNTSSDGTEELLESLAEAGEITHYHVDPRRNQSPQSAAVRMFEAREGYRDGHWYLWLDADEFLNIHVGARRVDDLASALGSCAGINLNWRLFGTSGHERFPGRFVSRDFPGATSERFGANRETKTLFRKSPDIEGFGENGIYRPRLAEGHGYEAKDFLAGNGNPMFADSEVTKLWLAGDRVTRTNIVGMREMGWALAQINHYSVRTPEFYELKKTRGRGAGKLRLNGNSRHNDEYFQKFNINGAQDLSIADWEDEVTDEIGRLLDVPSVAEASARSAALVRKELSAIAIPSSNSDQPIEPQPAPAISSAATPGDFPLAFDKAEAEFVARYYSEAENILEYGSGGSTILAAKLGKHVIGVESDRLWAERLGTCLTEISDKAQVHHVDIGPTKRWGIPKQASFFRSFHLYATSVWDRPDLGEPDLVLIDGRYRASCLATVMLRTKHPVTVLFDDYVGRRYYQAVEFLARKEEVVGRMARFTVTPGQMPPEMLTEVIGWFSDQR